MTCRIIQSVSSLVLLLILAIPGYCLEPNVPVAVPTSPQFEDGRSGNAFVPKEGPPLTYALTSWDVGAGTISLWVRLNEPASQMNNTPLVSSGAPPATWLYLYLNQGKLGFLFQRGEKPFAGAGEFYLNTTVDIMDWEPDVWHHIVVTWAAAGTEASGIKIVVDGTVREERYNQTLQFGVPIESLIVGTNSASVQTTATQVTLDELRIWNLPLNSNEIKETSAGGMPLPESLVLAVDFDSALDGQSGVQFSTDFTDPSQLVERLQQ